MAQCGASVVIKKGATAMALIRDLNITFNNADVEVGTGQWRELLSDCGEKSVEMSGQALIDSSVEGKALVADIVAGNIDEYTVEISDIGDLTGDFKLSGSLAFPRHDATVGPVTLKSSGAIVYTPA